jgi:hypothetical protein
MIERMIESATIILNFWYYFESAITKPITLFNELINILNTNYLHMTYVLLLITYENNMSIKNLGKVYGIKGIPIQLMVE